METIRKQVMKRPHNWGDPPRSTTAISSGRRESQLELRPKSQCDQCRARAVISPNAQSNRLLDKHSDTDVHATIMRWANGLSPSISTKGWDFDSILQRSANFRPVKRVGASVADIHHVLESYEENGLPLIIEGWHQHKKWPKDMFTLDFFRTHSSDGMISVRNIHDWTDGKMPLTEFIAQSRATDPYTQPGEHTRMYGKDAECPAEWSQWLKDADTIPEPLLWDGSNDYFRYRPKNAPVETLMCYLGIGDTFTPAHKDLCASSGHNLMCYTENDGASFWFMTESSKAAAASEYFQQLNQELDHETHIITIDELANAPFEIYVAKQVLGDLVLVPPRSCHQVVNFGGITIKTSWSRMSLKGLSTAFYHELPIYQRVCREETYRVKSTIFYALRKQTKELEDIMAQQKDTHSVSGPSRSPSSTPSRGISPALMIRFPISNTRGEVVKPPDSTLSRKVQSLKTLVGIFGDILVQEDSGRVQNIDCLNLNDGSLGDEQATGGRIVCDFCGADIFQSFLECLKCAAPSPDGSEAPEVYTICAGCYVDGRSCKCLVMKPKRCFPPEKLRQVQTDALEVLRLLDGRGPRIPPLNSEYSVFDAACRLQASRNKKYVCTYDKVATWAMTCRGCHNSRCFEHLLSKLHLHAVEAIVQNSEDQSDNHRVYHKHHLNAPGRFTDSLSQIQKSQSSGGQGPVDMLRAHYALKYSTCKPVKPQFSSEGFYDVIVQHFDEPFKEPPSDPIVDDAVVDDLPGEMEGVRRSPLLSALSALTPCPSEAGAQPKDDVDEAISLPAFAMGEEVIAPEKPRRERLLFVRVPQPPYSIVRETATPHECLAEAINQAGASGWVTLEVPESPVDEPILNDVSCASTPVEKKFRKSKRVKMADPKPLNVIAPSLPNTRQRQTRLSVAQQGYGGLAAAINRAGGSSAAPLKSSAIVDTVEITPAAKRKSRGKQIDRVSSETSDNTWGPLSRARRRLRPTRSHDPPAQIEPSPGRSRETSPPEVVLIETEPINDTGSASSIRKGKRKAEDAPERAATFRGKGLQTTPQSSPTSSPEILAEQTEVGVGRQHKKRRSSAAFELLFETMALRPNDDHDQEGESNDLIPTASQSPTPALSAPPTTSAKKPKHKFKSGLVAYLAPPDISPFKPSEQHPSTESDLFLFPSSRPRKEPSEQQRSQAQGESGPDVFTTLVEAMKRNVSQNAGSGSGSSRPVENSDKGVAQTETEAQVSVQHQEEQTVPTTPAALPVPIEVDVCSQPVEKAVARNQEPILSTPSNPPVQPPVNATTVHSGGNGPGILYCADGQPFSVNMPCFLLPQQHNQIFSLNTPQPHMQVHQALPLPPKHEVSPPLPNTGKSRPNTLTSDYERRPIRTGPPNQQHRVPRFGPPVSQQRPPLPHQQQGLMQKKAARHSYPGPLPRNAYQNPSGAPFHYHDDSSQRGSHLVYRSPPPMNHPMDPPALGYRSRAQQYHPRWQNHDYSPEQRHIDYGERARADNTHEGRAPSRAGRFDRPAPYQQPKGNQFGRREEPLEKGRADYRHNRLDGPPQNRPQYQKQGQEKGRRMADGYVRAERERPPVPQSRRSASQHIEPPLAAKVPPRPASPSLPSRQQSIATASTASTHGRTPYSEAPPPKRLLSRLTSPVDEQAWEDDYEKADDSEKGRGSPRQASRQHSQHPSDHRVDHKPPSTQPQIMSPNASLDCGPNPWQ